jgi:hypothetical protein
VYNKLLIEKTGVVMKGSIRFIVGLLITFGAVGTLDVNPDANVLVQFAIAMVGCGIMYSGVRAMKKDM